eukprot:c32737_g1_i1.p1 GENE.c32737_g1_i1~~c32737_g1_i1.p1  ORF type:complete len:306 (-),score=65.46 c32737_g1_i1:31-918(-)
MAARVAVCQMRTTADLERNLAVCSRLIRQAVSGGASLVCLPENFAFMGTSSSESVAIAQPLSGPRMASYRNLAKENNVWLSLGGFQEAIEVPAPAAEDNDSPTESVQDQPQLPKQVYNTHVIIDNDGAIKAIYRKIHLFDVDIKGGPCLLESSFTQSGRDLVVCDSPVGVLGLTTCYDVRFPELYRKLALMGAQVLLVPAAFTVPTGSAHWHVLLRARAIENQCFVVAAAQVGQHNEKRKTFGHGVVVDAWGTVLADLGEEEEAVAVIELPFDAQAKIRREMPVWTHRRPDVYGQ